MSALPETIPSESLLKEVPERDGYRPTNRIAWFIGRYDPDRVLGQMWESDYVGREPIWVILPEFLLS